MKKLSILAISVALFASITACGAFGGLPSLKSSFVLSEDTIPGTNETVKRYFPTDL